MSKKSKINSRKGGVSTSAQAREYFSTTLLDREALIEEGVKESRIDNSYSRKQNGKARDAARREKSNLNRRKLSRKNSR